MGSRMNSRREMQRWNTPMSNTVDIVKDLATLLGLRRGIEPTRIPTSFCSRVRSLLRFWKRTRHSRWTSTLIMGS